MEKLLLGILAIFQILVVSFSDFAVSYSEREKKARIFNISKSRKGKAAINEAVDFLSRQEAQIRDREKVHSSPNSVNQRIIKCIDMPFGTQCPVCNVTFNEIIKEGMFEYLGDDAKEPYDHTCWSLRIRLVQIVITLTLLLLMYMLADSNVSFSPFETVYLPLDIIQHLRASTKK